MAFGRRKNDPATKADEAPAKETPETSEAKEVAEDTAAAEPDDDIDDEVVVDFDGGPFDLEDFENPDDAVQARLDLGSVLVPMPAAGQVQVELNEVGVPSAVWVVTPNGRFTIAAYAAPKSPGLWREVAKELADSLRKDNAQVSIQTGPWGREVVGTGAGVVRFVGVDGYRWMIRCVVNGAPEAMDNLVAEAREALADTVVRRGETPLPVRTPLPVQLPEPMLEQLRQAAAQQAQMMAAQQAMVQEQQAQAQGQLPTERRSASGSAMQQLRSSSTGG